MSGYTVAITYNKYVGSKSENIQGAPNILFTTMCIDVSSKLVVQWPILTVVCKIVHKGYFLRF